MSEKQEPTRQRVLEAALEVFAERGYDGASVRDVCARAGVNGAAVNYHWGAKDKLWLAVCEETGRRFLEVAKTRVQLDGELHDVADSIVGTMFDTLLENPKLARVLAWASLQADSLDFEAAAEPFKPIVELATRFLGRLQRDGRLPADVDLEAAVTLLYGQMLFAFIDQPGHRIYFGKDFSNADHAARIRRALIRSARLLFGTTTETSVVRSRRAAS